MDLLKVGLGHSCECSRKLGEAERLAVGECCRELKLLRFKNTHGSPTMPRDLILSYKP